jgi:hypothetical protein
MLGSEGRLGIATAQYRETLKARLLVRLKDQIGLTQQEWNKVDSADRRWVKLDFVLPILNRLNVHTNKAEEAKYQEISESLWTSASHSLCRMRMRGAPERIQCGRSEDRHPARGLSILRNDLQATTSRCLAQSGELVAMPA